MDVQTKTVYRGFNFSIASELPLPELPLSNAKEKNVDIVIKRANLLVEWKELGDPVNSFVIKKDFILFRMPEVAIFLIKDGEEILVSPTKDNPREDLIRLYILGTCMGAILIQRKILPLHGSAVVIDGKAYAIVGDSGAGKSTLASAFLNRGYQLLSDDVIPVRLSSEGTPYITPAYPQQKLWQESLNQFGIESQQFQPVIDRETKFAIPVSEQFAQQELPLAGVIELVKTKNEEIEIQPILTLERLHTLFVHTYRNFFINHADLMQWHFDTTTSIANKIGLFRLQRPATRFTAQELTEVILETIKKEEKIYD